MLRCIQVKQGAYYVTIEPIYDGEDIVNALVNGEIDPWYATVDGKAYLYSLVDAVKRSDKENEDLLDR